MTTTPIETPRMILRSTREMDGGFCLSLWLDDEMGRYLADPPRALADEAELTFAHGIEEDEGWYPFVGWNRETGKPMATCSAVPCPDGITWDIGYAVHRDDWRQGYGREMVAALIGFCRTRGGRVITAEAAQENAASCALLRSLGFIVARESSFAKRLTDIRYSSYIFRLEFDAE